MTGTKARPSCNTWKASAVIGRVVRIEQTVALSVKA